MAQLIEQLRQRRIIVVAVAVLVLLVVFIAIKSSGGSSGASGYVPTPPDVRPEQHGRGGSVRVGVMTPPEMSDAGDGGATLRQLVLPSLFSAQPDGSWRADLAVPGSDKLASNKLSAQFQLRPGAVWSDGSRITADDLRRTIDKRFVSSIEGPDSAGNITVYFTQKLPEWRRLWSGDSAIRPADANNYGGPYRVQSVTTGLQTVLVRNDKWWGSDDSTFLDEIDLVVMSDSTTAQALLTSGQVDVLNPVEDTVRLQQLKAIKDVAVSQNEKSGRWAALRLSPSHVADADRPIVMNLFPRSQFIGALLEDEVKPINGLLDNDTTWDKLAPGVGRLPAKDLGIAAPYTLPLTPLFDRSFARAVVADGATAAPNHDEDLAALEKRLELNNYDAMLEIEQDGPSVCWVCHFDDVDHDLAVAADGGDAVAAQSLENKLHDSSLLLPLWRPTAVSAYRSAAVSGVAANGFVSGGAWNAAQWWKPAS